MGMGNTDIDDAQMGKLAAGAPPHPPLPDHELESQQIGPVRICMSCTFVDAQCVGAERSRLSVLGSFSKCSDDIWGDLGGAAAA